MRSAEVVVTPAWRGRRPLTVTVGVLATCVLAACKAPPELRPDQVLQDSLGLTDRDRVHTIRVSVAGSGAEVAVPARLEVLPGDRVSIEAVDRRARTLRFERDSLAADAGGWAEEAGLFAAPLLPDSGARWILDFAGAPPGPYPFRVVGGGPTGSGVILVGSR